MIKKKKFKRMYETRNVRPYYTILHLGVFGSAFKELVGFEYKETIYVISPHMNNSAYFEVSEMERATEYFRELWEDEGKTIKIIKDIKKIFKAAVTIEHYGWTQHWGAKKTEVLLREMNKFFDVLFKTFNRMIVSQPQHVVSLEQKINKLLEGNFDKDRILTAATYFPGDLPWAEEEKR